MSDDKIRSYHVNRVDVRPRIVASTIDPSTSAAHYASFSEAKDAAIAIVASKISELRDYTAKLRKFTKVDCLVEYRLEEHRGSTKPE